MAKTTKTIPLLDFLCGKENPTVEDMQILRCKLAGNGTCKEIVEELHKPCYKFFVSDEICPRIPSREIKFTDFTTTNAFTTMVFGGYLNVSAIQYFYCKYRVKLRWSYLPLVTSCNAKGSHADFFPLEFLDICINTE